MLTPTVKAFTPAKRVLKRVLKKLMFSFALVG